MEIKMVLHLPRDAVSVPVCRQVLNGCLETLGVTPDTRADIALALSEACANVVLHAGPGDEYEVQVSAKDRKCAIEVVNAGRLDSGLTADGHRVAGEPWGGFPLTDQPVPVTAERGRGLRIIDAVAENLRLTGNQRHGTTVHFEKTLEWLPEAAGQHLLNADGGAGH
ncbi:MAG TPA: ATP-binding protein [Trebonia sp.]